METTGAEDAVAEEVLKIEVEEVLIIVVEEVLTIGAVLGSEVAAEVMIRMVVDLTGEVSPDLLDVDGTNSSRCLLIPVSYALWQGLLFMIYTRVKLQQATS